MTDKPISKRKMESYRRAEVVGQAARSYISKGARATQDDLDMLVDCVIDWMDKTGNVCYEPPRRRSRIDRRIK